MATVKELENESPTVERVCFLTRHKNHSLLNSEETVIKYMGMIPLRVLLRMRVGEVVDLIHNMAQSERETYLKAKR